MSINFKTSITTEEINKLPLCYFKGQIHVIDNCDYPDILSILKNEKIIGFDTETKPSFKKGRQNSISLLQLAIEDHAFLFRLQRAPLPQFVIEILNNPEILKVGIAVKDDIKSIKKIIDFEPNGFIELQAYVKQFGIENNGLKQIAAIVLGYRISKGQQTSNWDLLKLTESQLIYAATDAWACYKIYKTLLNTQSNAKL
jgi:ribonuclease D